MMTYALHLGPKQDLMKTLNTFVQENQLKASYIFTCAGSLTRAVLGVPTQPGQSVYDGHFEIVSLVGTLSPGCTDLELLIADESGNTIDGQPMPGCATGGSVDIVLSELTGLYSTQPMIPRTGYSPFLFFDGAD